MTTTNTTTKDNQRRETMWLEKIKNIVHKIYMDEDLIGGAIDIRSLLHQRDSEIREKIQGMIKKCEECGKQDCEAVYEYNMALDDLLTYLSNRT